jgi:hypothetical protein
MFPAESRAVAVNCAVCPTCNETLGDTTVTVATDAEDEGPGSGSPSVGGTTVGRDCDEQAAIITAMTRLEILRI